MKKLVSLLTGFTIVASSVSSVLSCSGSEKIQINEKYDNYWQLKKIISKKANIKLSDFTLDWSNSNKSLKFRPIVGTDLYNNHKNIPDTFDIDDHFNSYKTNYKLSSIKNMFGPLTGRKLKIAYDKTTTEAWKNAAGGEPKDKAEKYMNEGYFQFLELVLGAKFDRTIYTGKYTKQRSDSDEKQKGIFTIKNKNNEKDSFEIPVNVSAVAINELYDTNERGGRFYLPKEVSDPKANWFETSHASYLGGQFEAEVNKMCNVDWTGDVLGYYSTDIAEIYKAPSAILGANDINHFFKVSSIKQDKNNGSISFNFINSFGENGENGEPRKKYGIAGEDKDGNIFSVNFNYTTIVPNDYNIVPKYVLGKDQSLSDDKFDGPKLRISKNGDKNSVKLNERLFTDYSDNKSLNDELKVANIFTLNNFSIKKENSDNKIKEEFIEYFNNATGSNYKWDNYLYAELIVVKEKDSVIVRPRFGSRVFSQAVAESMATKLIGDFWIKILPKYDHTVASYAFNINYQK